VYTCPQCEEAINQASEICPYCGSDLTVPAEGEKENKPKFLKIAIFWGGILGILWAIAWFALPWRMAGVKPDAELRARGALEEVRTALAAYQASEGTLPSGLEALGDRARTAAQEAQSAHYTVQYTPGNPDANGRIKTYTLIARAGNSGYINFFTDETGIFRSTREDRKATTQDPPLAPVSSP
jgi:hypothetical protein